MDEKALEGLKKLREPFPDNQISKLPKGTKAQNDCPADQKQNCSICGGWHHPKVKHLDYVGHAALTDRLLEVDPEWHWEPLAYDEQGLPRFDKSGGLWIKLTICGVTRFGYGNAESKSFMDVGAREKEVIGDALRNAGMRFGAALDLWHKGDLHKDEEEQKKSETTMITPDHVDQEKVKKAADWLKAKIDEDDIEKNWDIVQTAYSKLSNNERMAIDALLQDKAKDSKRSYKNILKIYLDHFPKELDQ
jgi:hypothetical protein